MCRPVISRELEVITLNGATPSITLLIAGLVSLVSFLGL